MVIGSSRHIVMARPEHFEVVYRINPTMRPEDWDRNRAFYKRQSLGEWNDLATLLRSSGFMIEQMPTLQGLPDTVFPSNAAVVLDGKVLVSRFKNAERRGEEHLFSDFFNQLRRKGLVKEVETLPEDLYCEGAGDAIWDHERQQFWIGVGKRTSTEAANAVKEYFGKPVKTLTVVSDAFDHLDSCFCLLSGGEVLFDPSAFDTSSLERIRRAFTPEQRIEILPEERDSLCLNAVNIGREVIMNNPSPRLKALLKERKYHISPLPLDSFLMAGGAANGLILRLDLKSRA